MKRTTDAVNTPKLINLRKRIEALRETTRIENHLQQKRLKLTRARLVRIVGETLLDYADRTPDFNLMLRGLLKNASDERDKKFLADTGWL